MIEYTIAIDPSINSLGYAIFRGTELVKYGLVKQPEITKQAADEEVSGHMVRGHESVNLCKCMLQLRLLSKFRRYSKRYVLKTALGGAIRVLPFLT